MSSHSIVTSPAPIVSTRSPGSARSAMYGTMSPRFGRYATRRRECAAVELSPSAQIIHREIAYLGSWFYGAEDYPTMLALAAGGLDVGRLVTHTVTADRVQEGVDAFVSTESGKVVVQW